MKKISRRSFMALVGAAAATASMTACGGNPSSGESKGSVYWLNFKPESDTVLQKLAADYKAAKGVDVKVVTAASGNYESTLTSEMDKSAAPTLFVIGNEAAVKTWENYAYDLKDTAVAKELNTDAYNLYSSDGKLASIGYCYESYGIIVNTKLLKEAGHTVEEIKDFASLKAVVEDIHARAKDLGFDAFTSSGMDGSSSWRFSGHLANMPLYWESVEDKWTGCPATLKGTYLDNFRNIWDLYINNSSVPASSLATGGYDAEKEFGNCEAVFFQNGSWEYGNLTDASKGYKIAAEDMAMIPIYCGVKGEENIGLCSGTENCWAVNAKASEANIKATLDFMYWCVTDAEASKALVGTFGVMPYKQAAASTNKFLNDANALANAGKTTVTWAFNYTPNVNDWRATLVAAMNIYDNDPTDGNWDGVENAFVNGWATQYQAANK